MAEYIDRDAIRNRLYDADAITMNGVAMLNNFPAADVEEVKHGRWIEMTDSILETYYDCSVCRESFYLVEGAPSDNLYQYCPNCGAKMDGGEENG